MRVYEPLGMDTEKWLREPVVELPVADLEFSHDINFAWTIDKLRGRDGDHADTGLPLVVYYDGVYWVEDGHHRIAAAILRGEQRVKVRLHTKADA